MRPSLGVLEFKFRFLRNNEPQSLFAKAGTVTDEGIALGADTLDFDHIAATVARDRVLFLGLKGKPDLGRKTARYLIDETTLPLKIARPDAEDIKRRIDRSLSVREVEAHHDALVAAGKGDLFRAVVCPECRAAIDLSELPPSPAVYCPFCATVLADNGVVITTGSGYRVCDECGMFDSVRGYTECYFYFLLAIWGYSCKRRYMCPLCAGRLFWKMLALNFLFVLGLIPTVFLKIQSLKGRDPGMKTLSKANALAQKGSHRKAQALYEELLRRFPDHPGILMNEAIGHLNGDDATGGEALLKRVLASCANYVPARRILTSLETPPESAQARESES